MSTEGRSLDGRSLYKRYSGNRNIEHFYIQVGGRIRREREAVGITQTALAALIGTNRPSLGLIESGRQRIQVHTLYAIAEILNVPITALLPTNQP